MEFNFSTTFELFAIDVVIEICELWPSFTFFTSAWNCFYLPPTRLTLFVMCRSFPCTEHWALQFLSAWLQLNFLMFINQPKWAKKLPAKTDKNEHMQHLNMPARGTTPKFKVDFCNVLICGHFKISFFNFWLAKVYFWQSRRALIRPSAKHWAAKYSNGIRTSTAVLYSPVFIVVQLML